MKLNASIASAAQSTNPLKAPATNSPDATSSTLNADAEFLWNKVLKNAPITGRLLFDQEHRSVLSAQINATRKEQSISHKQHAGMLNAKLKIEWEQLGDRQSEWEAKAALLASAEKDGLLYQFVLWLDFYLTSMLI